MIYSDEHSREHIKEIQRLLYEISFHNNKIPMIIPDGVCSPETSGAIKIFQQEYGIPVTGSIDFDTWEKLVEVNRGFYPEILMPDVFRQGTHIIPGSEGSAVHFVQIMLNAIGRKYQNIPAAEITGIYDASTENAVRAFKKAAQYDESSEGIDACVWNSIVAKFNKIIL